MNSQDIIILAPASSAKPRKGARQAGMRKRKRTTLLLLLLLSSDRTCSVALAALTWLALPPPGTDPERVKTQGSMKSPVDALTLEGSPSWKSIAETF